MAKKDKTETTNAYDSIIEMPLYNFLKCLCDSDYSFLYKETPKKRDTAWETERFSELLIQYSEQMDEKGKSFETIKKQSSLIAKIRILEASLSLINRTETASILRPYGIKPTKDPQKNILLIQGKIDGFVREYKNLHTEKREEKPPTIQHYTDILITISTHFKMHLDIRTITVASFCSYCKRFTEEIENIKRITKKQKNHGRGKH